MATFEELNAPKKYQNPLTGQISLINPAQNPDMIKGLTLVPDNTPFSANPSPTNYGSAPITSAMFQNPTNLNVPNPTFSSPYNLAGLQVPQITPGPKQQQASDTSTELQNLNKSLIGESAYQTQQEDVRGIPGLTTQITDLSSKITGLQNEQLALQNEYNYTIPNQTQESAMGRGITAGGLAPITASELRKNQIKQGIVATEALTTSALLSAAQGHLTNAQYLADRAVKAKFDPLKEEIAAKKANLELLLKDPTLTVEENNQAALLIAYLDQRTRSLDAQTKNVEDVHKMAIAAVSNNPNNPDAVAASTHALGLNSADPNYLSQAATILGAYQTKTGQDVIDLMKTYPDAGIDPNKDTSQTAAAKAAASPSFRAKQANVESVMSARESNIALREEALSAKQIAAGDKALQTKINDIYKRAKPPKQVVKATGNSLLRFIFGGSENVWEYTDPETGDVFTASSVEEATAAQNELKQKALENVYQANGNWK